MYQNTEFLVVDFFFFFGRGEGLCQYNTANSAMSSSQKVWARKMPCSCCVDERIVLFLSVGLVSTGSIKP